MYLKQCECLVCLDINVRDNLYSIVVIIYEMWYLFDCNLVSGIFNYVSFIYYFICASNGTWDRSPLIN